MFPHTDPTTTLELHRMRVAERIREAADHQRARTAGQGRHRRFGRWRKPETRGRTASATVAA